MDKLNQLIQKAKKKGLRAHHAKESWAFEKEIKAPPSSYVTVPYYFPTEQVDIVNKLRPMKKRKKK